MSKYEVISTSSSKHRAATHTAAERSVFPHFPISKWFYSQNQQHAIRWFGVSKRRRAEDITHKINYF